MNNKIKKIIATTLAISAISAIQPAKYLNLMTTTANAAEETGLSSLKINKANNSNSITMYKDRDYKEEASFKKSRDSYYATTNVSSVSVTFKAESGYEAKAFSENSSSADAYDSGDKIKLDSGSNTIYIRTYEKGDFNSSNVKSGVVSTYKIQVKKVSETFSSSKIDSEDYDDYQDEIYLKKLELSNIDFRFVVDKATYNIEVPDTVTETTVTAEPKKDGHTVKINGSEVTDSDDYEKTIALDRGRNVIKIKVSDDDLERTYTFNITRGDESSNTISTSTTSSSSTGNTNILSNSGTINGLAISDDNKYISDTINNSTATRTPNTWVKTGTTWQYIDEKGNVLKDAWHYDTSTNKYYYLKFSGDMTTDWRFINGNWYYFDESGAMQTGWLQSKSGKWYYLNPSGEMARNITVDGYRLGIDGAML